MKLDEFFTWATATLLRSSQDRASAIRDYLARSYVLNEIFLPGHYSLGARSKNRDLNFDEWLQRWAGQAPRALSVGSLRQPAPWESGFQGPSSEFLQVDAGGERSAWQLMPFHNPPVLMTAEQFGMWIDAQDGSDALWAAIATAVLDFLVPNQLALFELADIRTWWASAAVLDAYYDLAADLCLLVQSTLFDQKQSPVLPVELRDLMDGEALDPGQDLPWDVWYYAEYGVSGVQLAELVAGLTFMDEVWGLCPGLCSNYPELAGAPRSPSDWARWLRLSREESWVHLASVIMQAVNQAAAGRRLEIPGGLANMFGPSPSQARQTAIRSLVERQGLALKAPSQGWVRYAWVELDDANLGAALAAPNNVAAIRTGFRSSLQALAAFADQNNSPFAEAFRLGVYFLDAGSRLVNDPRSLAEHDFSTTARANVADRNHLVEAARIFGETDEGINQMLALDISDVFGGMGSWNDYTGPGDMDEHGRLSAELAGWRRQYFQLFVSGNTQTG